MAAWELWEHALLPSLISGAGSWLGEIQDTVELCNSITKLFLAPYIGCTRIIYKGSIKKQNK